MGEILTGYCEIMAYKGEESYELTRFDVCLFFPFHKSILLIRISFVVGYIDREGFSLSS